MIKRVELKKHHGYYFPLFNRLGMRSAITPYFQGDLKLDQHHYALSPVSELDLYKLSQSRNVIFEIDGKRFDLNGSRAHQQEDRLEVEVSPMYQKVFRTHKNHQIITTSFVAKDELIECHEVVYRNLTNKKQKVKALVAMPLYGRSADNIRDHRHVTSLLNKVYTHEYSVSLKPTLLFNEKGHFKNDVSYGVSALSSDMNVIGFIPTMEQYLNGGSYEYPRYNQLTDKHQQINGYECMGGIQFDEIEVHPHASIKLYIGIEISQSDFEESKYQKYLTEKGFHDALRVVVNDFDDYLNHFNFEIENEETTNMIKWVVLQPLLRRYFGNSFLPHHDYGHGGKGWRDLWQDLLGMIMTGDKEVYQLLFDNFRGVRIDGSNATIIGDEPGEFIADRNSITRVWSDHGAWPLITVSMYIDETNDIEFLLKKQTYFFDQFTHYTHQKLKEAPTIKYEGTILEHLLLQNLVPIHHKGKHGYIKIEDADWNDGLDMAKEHGETIAFTHMYINNLRTIRDYVYKIEEYEFEFFEDLFILLEKDADLNQFFDNVADFKGKKKLINKTLLIDQLDEIIEPYLKFIQEDAFKYDRYEAYYDHEGKLLDNKETVNLTGQAMALLSKTATKEQASKIAKKTKEVLFDPLNGGYHLNSPYDSHMGRGFQFAYNHKENGAVFSHMAMMYAYGLYQYDLVPYAREAIFALMHRAQGGDSEVLVGIPEYFTEQGVGKYSYLTGSASWLLKVLRTEVFGIHMNLGVLHLEPKLMRKDFIHDRAKIKTTIQGRLINVTYHNPKHLEYGNYKIKEIVMSGHVVDNDMSFVTGDIEVYLDETL